jgi:hypothetical protein
VLSASSGYKKDFLQYLYKNHKSLTKKFMNTVPSHLVINAAIEKKIGAKFKLAKSAFLWGSVGLDFPLLLISVGYFVYYRYFTTQDLSGILDKAFGEMYFNDPIWIAGRGTCVFTVLSATGTERTTQINSFM